jgi:hypothetical protein
VAQDGSMPHYVTIRREGEEEDIILPLVTLVD